MGRQSLLVMGLLTASVSLFAGCGHTEVASGYDPRVDGLQPVPASVPDMSVLEDQRTIYTKLHDAGTPKPVAAPAPAAAPAPNAG